VKNVKSPSVKLEKPSEKYLYFDNLTLSRIAVHPKSKCNQA